MKNDKDILSAFNRFAGRPVNLTEQTIVRKITKPYGSVQETRYSMDEHNPVIDEILQTAQDMGVRVRIWTPGMQGGTSYDKNRINIRIHRDEKGGWCVGKQFDLF